MKLSFFSILKSASKETGFSLVEVMVGGGIIAGVALAGATLFRDQKEGQKRIEHDQKLQNFHAALIKVVTNQFNCNATFSANYNQASLQDISSIYECASCAPSAANSDYNAGNSPRRPVPFISEGAWIENTNGSTNNQTRTWRIVGAGEQPNGGMVLLGNTSSTGNPTLRVTYQFNPDLKGGGRRISKDIPLNVRFGGGLFKECIGGMESSGNNLSNDICSSLNPRSIQSEGNLVYWDATEQRCVTNNTIKSCNQPGQYLIGIDSLGRVKCGDIASPTEVPKLESPGVRCGAGTQAQVIGVNGRIEVRCI